MRFFNVIAKYGKQKKGYEKLSLNLFESRIYLIEVLSIF